MTRKPNCGETKLGNFTIYIIGKDNTESHVLKDENIKGHYTTDFSLLISCGMWSPLLLVTFCFVLRETGQKP